MPFNPPANLDGSDNAVRSSQRVARANPWDLDEHDIWRLDVPHLWFALSEMYARTHHRQTTAREAAVMARCRFILEHRKDDYQGQQLHSQILMSDLAAYCRAHWNEHFARSGGQN